MFGPHSISGTTGRPGADIGAGVGAGVGSGVGVGTTITGSGIGSGVGSGSGYVTGAGVGSGSGSGAITSSRTGGTGATISRLISTRSAEPLKNSIVVVHRVRPEYRTCAGSPFTVNDNCVPSATAVCPTATGVPWTISLGSHVPPPNTPRRSRVSGLPGIPVPTPEPFAWMTVPTGAATPPMVTVPDSSIGSRGGSGMMVAAVTIPLRKRAVTNRTRIYFLI